MDVTSKQQTIATMLAEYNAAEFCLHRAWDQVILLQNKLFDLKVRYDRAKAVNYRSFQYVFKQRKLTIEKMLEMYALYAEAKADQVFHLCIFLMLIGHSFDDESTEAADEDGEEMVEESFYGDDENVDDNEDYYIDGELVTSL
ncbi:hypothetical protein SNE40_004564 [Patella caerulea]|uniref:Uncharacterized protein n=1 Tax=Patella caerulea TaxID=87958 RepID=A0AAN8K398_PATCE